MDRLLKKKTYFALLYVFTALLIEIITFCVMGLGVFPSFWGIDLAFILGLAIIIFVIPSPVASIVVNGVLLGVQVIVAFINEALYRMSGMVFSLNMLNLATEVGGVFSRDFVNWWLVAGLVALLAAEITCMVFLNKYLKTEHARFTRNAVIILLVCCIIGENAAMILYQATLNTFRSATVSDELADYNDDNILYTTQFIPSKALKKFGFFGFYFMNVSNTLNSLLGGGQTDGRQSLLALDNYFSQGEMSESTYGDNLYTGMLNGKNIVLIVIESGEWYGINQEYTPTLYAMANGGISFTEYYARDKTNHSEAMSILGSYPIDPQNDVSTKLKESNLSFTLPNVLRASGYTTNYFHPNTKSFYNRNVTHGAGGNYGFDTAHFLEDMPALDGCDENGNVIKKNFYNFDRDALVTENYFDDYTRKEEGDRAFFTMHMTLSSHGAYNDLVDYGDYPFSDFSDERYYDSDMTEEECLKEQARLKEEFSKKAAVKNFEKYYRLIDGYPQTFAAKGIELDTSDASPYSPETLEKVYLRYKRFQAGLMDLDEAVNSLLYDLERTGRLDDTAFVFYADHTAYYNEQNYYLKGVPLGEGWNTALYNIPAFLWYGGSMDCDLGLSRLPYEGYHNLSFRASKDLKSPLRGGTKVDKFTCSFDILPTLLQLTGYSYNTNLYHGVSMFSDRSSVFVSRESGLFTNDIYYDGTTVSVKGKDGVWTHYDYESTRYSEDGFTEDVKAFLKQTLRYYEKQSMLEEMYKCDYFSRRPVFGSVAKDGKIFHYIRPWDGASEA